MTTDAATLLARFERVCLASAPDARDVALLESGGGPAGRFGLYRDLVRARLFDLVASALPRTAAALGRERLRGLAGEHLARSAPTSRFFREYASSFASWVIERWTEDAALVPVELPWAPDLLRLEAAQWEANFRPITRPTSLVPFDLERVPIASDVLVRLRLGWSVHLTSGSPVTGAFRIAVYRRPDHQVETRWMEPLWGDLLDRFVDGREPAIDSVRAVLAAHARVPDAEFVDELSSFVAALVDHGALSGSVA